MNFAPIQCEEDTIIAAWKADHVTVVNLAYTFGQIRVQVWYDEGRSWPAVIGLNF